MPRLARLLAWVRRTSTPVPSHAERRSADAASRAVNRLVESRQAARDLLDLSEAPEPDPDVAWRPLIRSRVVVALAMVTLWAVGVQARLVYLQVVRHDYYVARAESQQQRVLRPSADRGSITDRHGNILAYSVGADSIVAYPNATTDPAATAASLCRALTDCTADERETLLGRLRRRSEFAWVRRTLQLSPDQVQRVSALGLPEVALLRETRRYYPNSTLASHVLGFVGQDNKGLSGVESQLEDRIRGREGIVLAQVDANQNFTATRVEQQPTAGATVELTIDRAIQHFAERELRRGVLEHRASGGTLIAMDPETGEILALANYPDFDPNSYLTSDPVLWRNRAIQNVYEPGSTFKVVTAAAAIEEGALAPNDMIDTSPGSIRIPGRSRPITDVGSHGRLPFSDVIIKSSNVGAVKVGLLLGSDRLTRWVHRFGFGQRLLPNFAGQSPGVVWAASDLTESGLASVSMGYQVSVTPIQMVTAVSGVANGGRLMEPHLVRAVTHDGVREPVEPVELRRIMRPETAAVLTTIMEGVVERGTGTKAQMARYQVAGKSGTAKKVLENRRGYSDTDYNASFVGFAPSRNPAVTVLVVIDTPRGGTYYGGSVAAPIFKRFVEATLQHMGVAPTIHPTPPIVVASADQHGGVAPAAARRVPVVADMDGQPLMPDLAGLGAREALRRLIRVGLTAEMTGVGVVVRQYPEAGTPIERGTRSRLRLSTARTEGRR